MSTMIETILVVDDNPLVLRVVVAIPKAETFKVLAADSGSSAIKLAPKYHDAIDLLLSDVKMPNMSGPDLGQELKKARPDLHVMLISGGGSEIYWSSITAGPTSKSRLFQ